MNTERLFGTDGIRGTPGEYPLTDGMLFKIGKAAARNVLTNRQEKTGRPPRIIIGNDTRISCYQIETILTSGVTSCGVDVLLNGVIPTAGLAFLTREFKADMGLMISASHNRAQDNGIKFFTGEGHKLSESEEERMEHQIFNGLINFNKLTEEKTGSVSKVDGRAKYIDFLKSSVPDLRLCGIKVVVDCGCGATHYYAPQLFSDLGAEVICIADEPNGKNINAGYGVLYPEKMTETVKECNADIGLAFDGDGDRLILSDEKGNIVDGDHVMAFVGIHLLKQNRLPKKTIVATVMSNWGLEQAIQDAGGRLIRTPVGDKYILETMRREGYTLGGEQSGHIIFLEHSNTGDGILTALQVLKTMKETAQKLSCLSQCMCKTPQVLINIEVKEKTPLDSIPEISQAISHSHNRLKGNGRLLVRYSGTEPKARVMVEGKNKDLIEEIANKVANAIKQNLGITGVKTIRDSSTFAMTNGDGSTFAEI